MYLKIQAQNMGGSSLHFIEYLEKQNQNSQKILTYLDKQNENLKEHTSIEREYFFSSSKDKVNKIEVFDALEKNHSGLKKKEAKFYTLIISPSQSELKHLEGLYGEKSKMALKQYTRDVMKGYATCMNREINGRALEDKDVVWYAMYENERTFSRRDWEVVHNKEYFKLTKAIKEGNVSEEEQKKLASKNGFYVLTKEGKVKKKKDLGEGEIIIREKVKKVAQVGQGHIHVIVHRRDKSGKISLSPLANSRGKEQIKNIYYKEGKRITKTRAEELSRRENKPIGQLVEIKQERRMIGFDRTYFKHYAEAAFDYKFNYERKQGESFWDYNTRVKDEKEFFEKHREKLAQTKKDISLNFMYRNNLKNTRRGYLKRNNIGILRRGVNSTLGTIKGEIKKELGISKDALYAYRGAKQFYKLFFNQKSIILPVTPKVLASKLVVLPIKAGFNLIKDAKIDI